MLMLIISTLLVSSRAKLPTPMLIVADNQRCGWQLTAIGYTFHLRLSGYAYVSYRARHGI
jgi:hypothetical protein